MGNSHNSSTNFETRKKVFMDEFNYYNSRLQEEKKMVSIVDSSIDTHQDSNVISTTFRWKSGGNQVFLTGTFTNWKYHILMEKNKNEFYTIVVRLQK